MKLGGVSVFFIGVGAALILHLLLEANGIVEPLPWMTKIIFKLALVLFMIFCLIGAWVEENVIRNMSNDGMENPKEEGSRKSIWIAFACLIPVYWLVLSRIVS